MKKILLSFGVIALAFTSSAQVSCVGVSPASIAGDYNFEWADGNTWGTPDFTASGVFVQDTLAIVDDGSNGLNDQGNPVSAEGCNPLVNGADVNGKIAVIYRNTCEFGTKALNAQNAGAVAVIILNRDDEVISMGGGADGTSVTIPVVMLSSSDGELLTSEMLNGPVVMFIGNKIGLNANDAGFEPDLALVAPFGTESTFSADGFDLGIQLINFGSNPQSNISVTAEISGPSGSIVYSDQKTNLSLQAEAQDTIDIFNNADPNVLQFPPFSLSSYPIGEYTLTYTLDLGVQDDDSSDNVISSKFSISDTLLSRANYSGNEPVNLSFPSNTDSEYQSCMKLQQPNSDSYGVAGVWFIPHHTDSAEALEGEEVLVNVYKWNDSWSDLNDETAWGEGAQPNAGYQNLQAIESESIILTQEQQDKSVLASFDSFIPEANQRYLFCAQTYNPQIAFAYDKDINLSGVVNLSLQPVGALFTEDNTATPSGRWFLRWQSLSTPAIGLNVIDVSEVSINENAVIEGAVAPNPATDVVRISVNAEGNANLVIADLSGKVVKSSSLEMNNGVAHVNIANLEDGMYIFNVTMENGQTAKINVVKK